MLSAPSAGWEFHFCCGTITPKYKRGKLLWNYVYVYTIGTETTGSNHPHQNPAENCIGTVKMVANRVVDRSGCPGNLWLRAVVFVSMILNGIVHRQLNGHTPTEVRFGYTPDISPFLQYEFYESVYCASHEGKILAPNMHYSTSLAKEEIHILTSEDKFWKKRQSC